MKSFEAETFLQNITISPRMQIGRVYFHVNTIIEIIVALVLIGSLVQKVESSSVPLNVTKRVSVQSTDEIFMYTLPMISSCTYNGNQDLFQNGSIQSENSTPSNIFFYFEEIQKLAFWFTVENGYDVLIQEDQLIANYSGLIYSPEIFNESSDEGLAGSNETTDIVMVFKTFPNGSLSIYDLKVSIDFETNFSLTVTEEHEQQINVSAELKNLIQDCESSNSSVQISNLNQEGIMVGLCQSSSSLFFFNYSAYVDGSSDGDNSSLTGDLVINLEDHGYSNITIDRMILNPVLEEFGVFEAGWNVFLLADNQSEVYACDFDPSQLTNFTCYNSIELGIDFIDLIEKLWYEEKVVEDTKLEKLIDKFGVDIEARFPGEIEGVFIDDQDNIFIQSSKDNITYVVIYDWEERLLLNITLPGDVLIFDGLQLVMQNSQTMLFELIKIELPLLTLNVSSLNSDSFQLLYDCEAGMADINFEFQIIYSDIQYPTSEVFMLEQPSITTEEEIYILDVQKYYEVFGPAFSVFFRGPSNIQATLLDGSIIEASSYILSIVQMLISRTTQNSIFRVTGLEYTTNDSLMTFSKGENIVKIKNPCQIVTELKGVQINSEHKVLFGYSPNQVQTYCLCPLNSVNCRKTSKGEVRKLIKGTSEKLSKKFEKLNALQLNKDNSQLNSNICESCIKSRIFTLIDSERLVTIYNNNSAILTDFWTGQYYDKLDFQCDGAGSLEGAIYLRQFMDPTMFIFCEQTKFLSQYRIRLNNVFLFQRNVPLYGFQTLPSANQGESIKIGNNFIFLEVDIDEASNSSINVSPDSSTCCVLRIDPFEDTVSVIKEIILANEISQVFKNSQVDVAYYSESELTVEGSFLKIYLGQTWIALNQSHTLDAVTPYQFDLVFSSTQYNMAFECSVNLTFDISLAYFYEISSPVPAVLSMEQQFAPESVSDVFWKSITFNYNSILGPIQNTEVFTQNQLDMIEDVSVDLLITPNKIVGSVGNSFLQVFTPYDGKTGSTLDKSILVVKENSIEVYMKEFENVGMYFVESIPTPVPSCQYIPFSLINETSVSFLAECIVPQFGFKVHSVNISLFLTEGETPKVSYDFFEENLIIALEDISSVIFDSHQYIVGIAEGPMESLTGKLYYCSKTGENTVCSTLYISTGQYLLLDYDTFQYSDTEFLIVTIDFGYLQIWNNPQPPTGSMMNSTYTFDLPSTLKDSITVITVINASKDGFVSILSGTEAYYEVYFDYSSKNLSILTTFRRYISCQKYDSFKVDYILDQSGNIDALIAECSQNKDTLRLEAFQSLNDSSIVTFTGFVQYFTKFGPISSLQQSQSSSYCPIKIIPISTSMINKLFMVYRTESNLSKFIYEQIDGVLIDNILTFEPSLNVTLTPLTTQINFPNLSLQISNNFYATNFTIDTRQALSKNLDTLEMVAAVILLFVNFLTGICLILNSAISYRKIREKQYRYSGAMSWNEASSRQDTSELRNRFRDRLSAFSIHSRNPSVASRKQTEIELFVRRSERTMLKQSYPKEV